jgi:hypothetical protein
MKRCKSPGTRKIPSQLIQTEGKHYVLISSSYYFCLEQERIVTAGKEINYFTFLQEG